MSITVQSDSAMAMDDWTVACDSIPTLIEEIVNAAFLVAATASTANCLARRETLAVAATELLSHLPPRLTGAPPPQSMPFSDEFSCALFAFDHRLAMLSELSGLTARTTSFRPDFQLIASNWQRAASQAQAILSRLEVEATPCFIAGIGEHIRLANLLLLAAALGESPCTDEEGAVFVPVPVERRGFFRATANRQVIFEINVSIQCAVMQNVSKQGLGVLGLNGAEPGNAVSLMIGPGHSVDGQIIWVQDHRAGIRFCQPLPLPLLDILTS